MLLSLFLIFFCLVCARNKFSVFVRNSDSAAAADSGCMCFGMHIHSHTTVLSDYDDGSLAIADANIVINNLQHNCRTVKYDW